MERIEDLGINGLKIIEPLDGFRFGTDAVLLSDFAKTAVSRVTVDLCTGGGIVPILLSAKTNTPRLIGVEIMDAAAERAMRSVALNGLDGRVEILNSDLKNAPSLLGKRCCDTVTVNPPYKPAGSGLLNTLDERCAARHEVLCTLDDVVGVAAQLLQQGGNLFMVHRPDRLADIIVTMRQHKIEPKRMQFVHYSADSRPSLVLVHGRLFSGAQLIVEPPIYLGGDPPCCT